MGALLKEYPTDNVVVPAFSEVKPPALEDSAIVEKKLDIETTRSKVIRNYQELDAEEASTVSFYVLKSRVADLKYPKIYENLPSLRRP